MPEKLDQNAVMSALRHLVRVPELYKKYKDTLTNDCFHRPPKTFYVGEDYGELPLLLIWQGLNLYYVEQRIDTAPSFEMLTHYIMEMLRRSNIFTDENLRYAMFNDTNPETGYLAYIYDPACDCNMLSGTPLIQAFLHERLVTDHISSLLTKPTSREEDTTNPLTTALSELTDTAQHIDVLQYSYEATRFYPEQDYYSSLPDKPRKRSTGISWVDESLGGGQRDGDCYSLLGGTGSGKTTLLVQFAVESAKQAFLEAKGKEPDKVLYYTFEQSADDLKPRFTSYGANILREVCEVGNDSYEGLIAPSMTAETCKPYEMEIWPDVATRKCEWERYQAFKRQMNDTLYLRNFSGVADLGDSEQMRVLKHNIGRRGVAEIYDDARRIMDHYGVGIRSLYIDYAGILCDRQSGYRTDISYDLLRGLGDRIRLDLAGRLGCTVYVAHQLTADFNRCPPIRMPSLADSAGCKSLANDMPTCWVMGTPDKTDHHNGGGDCVYFRAAKQRYAGKTRASQGMILQHDKNFYRMNDVTDLFCVDKPSRSFRLRRRQGVANY